MSIAINRGVLYECRSSGACVSCGYLWFVRCLTLTCEDYELPLLFSPSATAPLFKSTIATKLSILCSQPRTGWLVSVSVAVRVFSPFHGCVGLESGTYGIDPFTRKMYTLLILPIAGYVCNLQAIICSSLSCVESEHNIQHQECSRLS